MKATALRITLLSALCSATLSGCVGLLMPIDHAAEVLTGGEPQNDLHHNRIAMVLRDDEGPSLEKSPRHTRIYGKLAGVDEDKSLAAQYRFVVVGYSEMNHLNYVVETPTLVADNVPLLKKDDVVEVRIVGRRDVMKDFSGTEDVNVIYKVICPSEAPDFHQCIKNLPGTPDSPKHKLVYADTPYATHWKDMGLTLTPRYDLATGGILPTASTPPARPRFQQADAKH